MSVLASALNTSVDEMLFFTGFPFPAVSEKNYKIDHFGLHAITPFFLISDFPKRPVVG